MHVGLASRRPRPLSMAIATARAATSAPLSGALLTALVAAVLGSASHARASEPAREHGTATDHSADVGAEDDVGDGAAHDEDARWSLQPVGYLRTGFTHVTEDPDYPFVGGNVGFATVNARIGIAGASPDENFSFRLTADGAVDTGRDINATQGTVDVRLRDAWIRWDIHRVVGVQVGQSLASFTAEGLRSNAELQFSDRAVAEAGIPVGHGFETPGMDVGRQIGLAISPAEDIEAGPIGVSYRLMVANGNGPNQILNDNRGYALFGRLELAILDYARLGGGVMSNRRSVGELPNRFDEADFGFSIDGEITAFGARVFGQFTQVKTEFDTDGSPERTRSGFHVEAGYRVKLRCFSVTPQYRYARYQPWADGGQTDGVDLGTWAVTWHTAGLRFDHPIAGLQTAAFIEYTHTVEHESRALNNDLVKVLAQVAW